MSQDRQAERDAIQAAIQRLLAGAPTRSTGALTVLQLAVEAGVKRWVLTHKHPDLRKAFEDQCQAVSGVPAAYHHLHARAADLESANRELRSRNAEFGERVDTYAQVIRELAAALEVAQTQPPTQGNVRSLTARRQASDP